MIRTLKGRLHLHVGDGGGHREYLGASRQVPGSALGAVDPRTPFANVSKGRNVRNVGIRENGIFGIFEGSRTIEKQKQNTQPFTATNQRA